MSKPTWTDITEYVYSKARPSPGLEIVEASKINTGDTIDDPARGLVIHKVLMDDGQLRFTVSKGAHIDPTSVLVEPGGAVVRSQRGPVTTWQADA